MSDEELFEECRKLFISEFAGLPISVFKKDRLFTECSAREGRIYNNAMISAMSESEKLLQNIKNLDKNSFISKVNINHDDFNKLVQPIVDQFQKNRQKIDDAEISSQIIGNLTYGLLTIRVEGDSMIDAGVFDGDIVVADVNQTHTDGDIVVASVLGKTFIKIYHENKGLVILESANKKYSDITITTDMNFSIKGVVRMKLQTLQK